MPTARSPSLPVLMLTVRHDDSDVLAGLEAGADDYVAKDSAGAIVLGRVRRLIQFRQMSSMAMLNQQLVQVGRLLAGIVHEIRGPLAVIRGSAEVLQLNDQPNSENRQWVEAILRNAQLLQLRLDHLMAAVRNSSSDVQLIDLPSLLQESAQLFIKGLPASQRNIQVHTDLRRGRCPPIRVDPGRLMQVLFNLLGNAQQALSSSGAGWANPVAGRHGRGRRAALGDRRRRRRRPGRARSLHRPRVRAVLHDPRRWNGLWIVPCLRDPQGAIRPADGA